MIKAIIYDLDNTLYPVPAIGEKLFAPLFRLIAESGDYTGALSDIKKEIMRTPFRIVAKRYNFSERLTREGIAIQEDLVFEEPIQTFPDYPEILKLSPDRYLVTTGFEKMQQSKIDQMRIRSDFREVHVVDPTKSSKKEVFAAILQRHGYNAPEVLVVGDDPHSELRAARELGLAAVLYAPAGAWPEGTADYHITHFGALAQLVGQM